MKHFFPALPLRFFRELIILNSGKVCRMLWRYPLERRCAV